MLLRGVLLAVLALVAVDAQDDPAQDGLPPGILLLSRIKRHIREEVERLPDYTCLETAVRYRHSAGEKRRDSPVDVLTLEVLNSADKELYASPGARDFHEESPAAFTAGGLTATGTFALHLRTLFVNDNAMFTYRGEDEMAGRRTVRYDYRVPQLMSGYQIQRAWARGVVGMKGSLWCDPDTLDLVSLEVNADEIPDRLELLSATQRIEYAPMRIGSRRIVLPQSAELRMLDTDGSNSRNVVEFTHCRSFGADATLSFEAADSPAAAAEPEIVTPPNRERGAVPAGLTVTIALWTPLTGSEPVGSPIEGRVAAEVRQKRKVVIPEGAVVRGRVRRMQVQDGYSMVGLEFDDVEIDGVIARFYGNVQEVDKPGQFVVRTSTQRPRRQMRTDEVYAGYVPGVALFLVPGKELALPRGFKTVWRTGSPK